MDKFDGKTLLMLGTSVGSVDIVRYAKRHGAKTIVADYLPLDRSVAKQYADQAFSVSTADLESLQRIVEENNVTAVLAGVSEFNLLQAINLAESNGFFFYCNRSQWELIENKKRFRELCIRHSIPYPRTYYCGPVTEHLIDCEFPVIVKPVDGSSSNGVTICRNSASLSQAITDAKAASSSGEVIVEEFFEGEEFTAHYVIDNGLAHLVSLDTRYPALLHGPNNASIPIARFYPSPVLADFRRQVDPGVAAMCSSLNFVSGVFFVQGIYNKASGRFCIFEAGLRSAGEAPYRLLQHLFGYNYLDNIVDYCLLGEICCNQSFEDMPLMRGKHCCILSMATPGGTIDKIKGVQQVVSDIPQIIYHECRYNEGDTIPPGDTLKQIVLRFFIVADSEQILTEVVRKINVGVSVLDKQGNDICVRFNI